MRSPVIIPAGKIDDAMRWQKSNRFHAAHERLFMYSEPDSPLESINVRVTGIGRIAKTALKSWPAGGGDASAAMKQPRMVYFGEELVAGLKRQFMMAAS